MTASSSIRRRLFGGGSTPDIGGVSRSSSAPPAGKNEDGEEVRLVTVSKLNQLSHKKGTKRRNGLIFVLGGIFGLFLAAFFAQQNEVIDLEVLKDLNFDTITDILPVFPPPLLKEVKEFSVGMPPSLPLFLGFMKHEREAVSYDSFAIGLHLQSQGVKALHPVIMVPGVISTGLESWGTTEVSRPYFRKRLWGSWSMMKALVTDKWLWKQHILLDKETGLDPPGIKLRAAQGFDAADFFITGYWIWNKIFENLATIGYDPTNAFTAAYDWRLSYPNLEVRDQYFTRLKNHIEVAVKTSNQKVVLVSHSMGSQVVYYFMKWVESPLHGGGGPSWVNTYIDSWINISGCMLGAMKSMPGLISGEMKDTAQLNSFAVFGLEQFLSRDERADLFRALPGISSMLPKGGNAIWGNRTWAPDDKPNSQRATSYGSFISFRSGSNSTMMTSSSQAPGNLTLEDSLDYLLSRSDSWYRQMVQSTYSHGLARSREVVEANENDPRKWINPLETRLPLAKDLKIYCFYGVGKDTERAYFYREDQDPTHRPNVTIDTGLTFGDVDHGVVLGEGDGTVNLLSAGYMCSKGWKMKRYNPAGVEVKVYEMPHEPDRFSPRGGPNTGDHVDILGRASLNDLILRVAGGKGEFIEEHFVSKIREYADKVEIYDDP